MSYAFLQAEDFALQALRRADPALAHAPVALVRGEGRKAVAAEVSPECGGLPPGLPATAWYRLQRAGSPRRSSTTAA
jgi:hypothetical protein